MDKIKHVLEIDRVFYEIGNRKILQDIYLKLQTGNVTGLLGRNGSGKTTLMQILYGEKVSNEQSIRIDREIIQTTKRHPELMRFLPQFNFIPKSLTLQRIFSDFELNFQDFFIEFPDFEKFKNNKIKELSKGEQRIVELYLILVGSSKFILLDEPFSQIMPLHIAKIRSLILREKKNKAILISDHFYHDVLEVADDVFVLKDGKNYSVKNLKEIESLGYI